MTKISILVLGEQGDDLISVPVNNAAPTVFCYDRVAVDSVRYYPGTDRLCVTVSTYPALVTQEVTTGDVCIWGELGVGDALRATGHETLWKSTRQERQKALREGRRV